MSTQLLRRFQNEQKWHAIKKGVCLDSSFLSGKYPKIKTVFRLSRHYFFALLHTLVAQCNTKEKSSYYISSLYRESGKSNFETIPLAKERKWNNSYLLLFQFLSSWLPHSARTIKKLQKRKEQLIHVYKSDQKLNIIHKTKGYSMPSLICNKNKVKTYVDHSLNPFS